MVSALAQTTRLRRSAIARSALASTALAMSALLALAGTAKATDAMIDQAQALGRTAHERPALPACKDLCRDFLAEVARRADDGLVAEPGEAPDFAHQELEVVRRRHAGGLDPGPRLRLGRTKDRIVRDVGRTYALFGSARHLSAFAEV